MTKLLYSLHSGNLYGTERMALATAEGLKDEFETIFFAPRGPFHDEAKRRGFSTRLFQSPRTFLSDIRSLVSPAEPLAAVGTRVIHTLAVEFWARLYRRPCANIQVIHGGADEKLSYGRKRWLECFGTRQVAVSEYVKQRLVANGSTPANVSVIENFLTRETIDALPKRRGTPNGVRNVAIVSRLDPIKRLDLLLDMLDLDPSLREIRFDVYGSGELESVFRARAQSMHPNVIFHGFRADVAEQIAKADLFLHLCPEEPFGLVILEAMAAGLPVLVPNRGGAGSIVQNGKDGFHFLANDPWSLAKELHQLKSAPTCLLASVVEQGRRALRTRFSAECGVAQYRKLIEECWAC